ncbi:MAG: (2Fe-2S)-binding protein [Alsobacter sp.]
MDQRNTGFHRLPAGRSGSVFFTVDGLPASAPAGEPLASALAILGYLRLRVSPRDGTPRGAFCFMGVCQECVVHVDGVLRQACLTPVAAGMAVELRGVP